MKNIILCVALVLAVTTVEAKTTRKVSSTNKSKFDVRVPVKNWIKKMNDGFRVSFAQGSLDTNVRLRQQGLDESISGDRNTKLQLSAGYEKIRLKEVGYSAFFTYQDINEGLQDFNGKNKEDIRSMRWSANATYGLTKQAYVYGGLNLNKYYGSEEVEANIDRGIGLQAGIGLDLHKKLDLEVEYLSMNNEGKIGNTNIDITARGVMIKLKTPVSFDI